MSAYWQYVLTGALTLLAVAMYTARIDSGGSEFIGRPAAGFPAGRAERATGMEESE